MKSRARTRTCLHLLELPVHFDERLVVEELLGNVDILQKAREIGALGEIGHATAMMADSNEDVKKQAADHEDNFPLTKQ